MNTILGAIVGDEAGSIYEFNNIAWQRCYQDDFTLLDDRCFATDDSIMTVAIMKALTEYDKDPTQDLRKLAIKYMQELGRKFDVDHKLSFGTRFESWIYSKKPKPYGSFGNGSAMRVSAVGWYARTEDEVKQLSAAVTDISHNHEEGLKGAEATAMCIFLARTAHSKEEIKQYVIDHYYDLNQPNYDINYLRENYYFNETCQRTVPEAISCFLNSNNFKDALIKGISIGGDCDTLCAILCSIAEAFYGVPDDLRDKAMFKLDPYMQNIVIEFTETVKNRNYNYEKLL